MAAHQRQQNHPFVGILGWICEWVIDIAVAAFIGVIGGLILYLGTIWVLNLPV